MKVTCPALPLRINSVLCCLTHIPGSHAAFGNPYDLTDLVIRTSWQTCACTIFVFSSPFCCILQAGVAEELLGMLESSSAQARAVACACLGDLAQAHPPLQLHLSQVTAPPCSHCTLYVSSTCLTPVQKTSVNLCNRQARCKWLWQGRTDLLTEQHVVILYTLSH